MNLDLFDDIEGLILRERESSLPQTINNSSGNTSPLPENAPLAMAYVPVQQWSGTSSPEDALENGSLFPELVLPFMRGGAGK